MHILFFLATVDLISALAHWLPTPNYHSCGFQAVILQFMNLSSFLWVLSVCVNQYRLTVLSVKYPLKFKYFYHLLSWGLPLISVINISSAYGFGPAGSWCWITAQSASLRGVWFWMPFFTVFATLVVLNIRIYMHLRSVIPFSMPVSLKRHAPLCIYTGVFMALQLPTLLVRSYEQRHPESSPPQGLLILHCIFEPLQGFVNAGIFYYSRIAQRHLRLSQHRGVRVPSFTQLVMETFRKKKSVKGMLTPSGDVEEVPYSNMMAGISPLEEKWAGNLDAAEDDPLYNIRIVSWNLAGKKLPSDLSGVVPDEKDNVDIFVFGMQECGDKKWISKVCDTLKSADNRFVLIDTVQMSQIYIGVWMREGISTYGIGKAQEATGLGNVHSNKGGVCVRLWIGDIDFCFVCAHLAAHRAERFALRRNAHCRQIIDRLTVVNENEKRYASSTDGFIDLSVKHDILVFFGDLNYRFDDRVPSSVISERIDAQDWKALYEYDQLRSYRTSEIVFSEFNDATPAFTPTYKLKKGTLNFTGKRTPAWCDRILWKTRKYLNMKLISFTSPRSDNLLVSDHLPVIGKFVLHSRKLKQYGDDIKLSAIWLKSLSCSGTICPDGALPTELYVMIWSKIFINRDPLKSGMRTGNEDFFRWEPNDLPVKEDMKVDHSMDLETIQKKRICFMVKDLELIGEEDELGFAQIELIDIFQHIDKIQKGKVLDYPFNVRLIRRSQRTGTLQGTLALEFN